MPQGIQPAESDRQVVDKKISGQADGQTGRQEGGTIKKLGRQADKQREREAGRQADKQTDRYSCKQIDRQAYRRTGRQAEK